MGHSKETKAKRDKRVSQMLDVAASSSIAVAARAFTNGAEMLLVSLNEA